MHLLYIWTDMDAPYIPNAEFRKLWGHGFVKIKKLDDVDNVGAYLTAYLGDMEWEDMPDVMRANGKEHKIVEVEEEGKKVKKTIIKGARLDLYPANFNMLRCSRGIKRPTVEMMSQPDAEKKVLGATRTYENSIRLFDQETGFESFIIKEQYNSVRR